ncbi:hypothetical protein DRN67_00190 [Candidatus Micrarchaeota archaeon]|nr:MAG: hypothetical protein DRN67_00190 [Candidatus Micrarchaeota archaeon]
MHMTVEFKGYLEEIVDEAIRRGIVKTRTEALRAGLLELADKYGLGEADDETEVLEEVRRLEEEMKKGRMKTYSKRQFEKKAGL